MISSSFLAQIRHKALRRGCWYRVLDRLERGIFDLASRLFDVIHGVTLMGELVKIVDKLVEAGKSPFVKHLEAHGVGRAKQVLEQAVRLGYGLSAALIDEGFVRYLMFLDFNQPIGWGLYPRA